ncbi:MAG: agmatinase [Thermomicrobiales bacterium]|jgi:agmatinase|nr:agmatinase [Thermomicrobiales bacterium]
MIDPIPTGEPSFIDAPRCGDLASLEADVAVIGVPNGWPYEMSAVTSPSSTAPRAIREQSIRYGRFLTHFDWEFDGPLFAGREVRVVDCGDVTMVPGDFAGNSRRTTAVVNAILDRGAIPIVLGGDHAIPIPVFRAYEGRGEMVVVQLDAHIDWRDERNGIVEGLSSTMRRASEMPWVTGMAQIGLRGIGSARQQEVDDARAYGSVLVRAEEVHEQGVEAILRRIPSADRYYITFDADGLDPAIAPGVNDPGFGGLTYYEATNLLRGVARKGRVVGFDFVEVVPSADVQNLTSLLAARLTLNLIGALVHEGQVGRG